MSLYHETADILSAPSSTGGNLKTRIFHTKILKSPKQQIYALAVETCKWSLVLKEVIEKSDLLQHERKLTPLVSLLLVHDLLLSKSGIALPASHGLRTSIERHKARLNAEFTRARLRRKAASLEALRQQVESDFLGEAAKYPRWVRVNTLKTTLEHQFGSSFRDFTIVPSLKDVVDVPIGQNCLYVDEHVPNVLALSPTFEISKAVAYTSGDIILQDKASCFPAYLLDPQPEDGDVIDSCAAPGNKTTHLAAIVKSHAAANETNYNAQQRVHAFEKDRQRSRTLEKMVKLAGGEGITQMNLGQDFLKVDPNSKLCKNVGCLLLDPSCSGSGIVGRDNMPTIHLPVLSNNNATKKSPSLERSRKRKREENTKEDPGRRTMVDDDGQEIQLSSRKELKERLEALSSFQLALILHAFKFPAAKKITYSTCSVYAEENEQVVLKALRSDIAQQRGWGILQRNQQIRGMREWPIRGTVEATDGDVPIADACIRCHQDDGHGVMGFFVAGFVRDASSVPSGPTLGRTATVGVDVDTQECSSPVSTLKNVSSGGAGHNERKGDTTVELDSGDSENQVEWLGFTD